MYSADYGVVESQTQGLTDLHAKNNFTAGMLCSLPTHCMCNSYQTNQGLLLEL